MNEKEIKTLQWLGVPIRTKVNGEAPKIIPIHPDDLKKCCNRRIPKSISNKEKENK